MIYPVMKKPFQFDSYRSLTPKQAREYFNWYVSMIPERVGVLSELFNGFWHHNVNFDYSLESLDPVWNYFKSHIETVIKSEEDMRKEMEGAPEWVIESELKDRRFPSTETLIVAMDLGMYLGETLVRNFPVLYWGFIIKPKNHVSVNRPVILGLKHKMDIDPWSVIHVMCLHVVRESHDQRGLREMVDVWKVYFSDVDREQDQ